MAGSGKTTLIQRINSHMHQHKLPGYIINLDPAVTHLPYGANIDIRDTVRAPAADRCARPGSKQADHATSKDSDKHQALAAAVAAVSPAAGQSLDSSREQEPACAHMSTPPHACMWAFACVSVQVNYKNVMKQYGLGPNGGILTASNLFATRFDQVGAGCRCQSCAASSIRSATAAQSFDWRC